MALFDKLFSLKRRLDADNCDTTDRSRSHQINPEQVRLLLFKECDWRGRRLLFDSSSIRKVPAGKHDQPSGRPVELPCIVEVADGFSYMYKGPEEDTIVLGEMIFGAVAMNYKSVSLKIHIMDDPRRLMCTKVFCVPTRRISRAERNTSDRTDASFRNTSMLSASKPLNVPSLGEDGVALSFSMDRGDSGYCGDQSPYSSVGSTYDYFSMFDAWDGSGSQEDIYSFHSLPGRKLSTSSNGSWQRRTFQNIATRFDLGNSSHHLDVPAGCDSQTYSNSSASGTSDSIASGSSLPPRKSKLGLAVLISVADAAQLDLVRKCVEHSPQLQALVCRLRLATLAAGAGRAFVSTLHRASEDAARWLSDLMYGPRLQPTWLAMVTGDARASSKLADTLLSDLCSVLAVGDTKTTNFFISTLLTHVLTYHLGWVTTVSPYDTVEHQPSPADPKRPYNALWAQLIDLCGSIGFPPRAARTIISGEKNAQFVTRLLSILTYFLRCGDVKRTEFRYKECAIREIKTVSLSVSPSRTQDRCDVSVPVNTQNSDSVSTLVSDVSLKKTATLADLRRPLSSSPECASSSAGLQPACLKRNPTVMLSSLKASSDSSLNSTLSNDSLQDQKVVFVLGDDEKLVGLKNKSTNGRCVKKSSRVQTEGVERGECEREGCEVRSTESPSKCCGQTLQHSKPIKHSGFKFEFDKYPQIVTNYMKSKNLEILDRHYIGKPGNLKLDNFQFDPMIVPPIQEEKCDACEKCQLMESMLQTPTNASEMEYMNDMPRISEPQYAKETTVTDENRNHRELSPKTFVRRRKVNVVVVNANKNANCNAKCASECKTDTNETERIAHRTLTVAHVSVLSQTPKISIQDLTESSPLQRSKLKFTKSTNNLTSLLCQDLDDADRHKLDKANQLNEDSLNIDSTLDNISTSYITDSNIQIRSKSNLKVTVSKSTSDISKRDEVPSYEEILSSSKIKFTIPSFLQPVELQKPEVSRKTEPDTILGMKSLTEAVLSEVCGCKLKRHNSRLDSPQVGGRSDHNVPDLIKQDNACEKCKQMESILQTPSNASEMNSVSDMLRLLEPQHAKETIVTEEDRNHRELSPKTFRGRKVNAVVVNANKNASNTKSEEETDVNETDRPLADETQTTVASQQLPKISVQDVAMDTTDSKIYSESRPLQRSTLKFTKSTNNLTSLLSQDLDTYSKLDEAKKLNEDLLCIDSAPDNMSTIYSKELSTEPNLNETVSKCLSEVLKNNEALSDEKLSPSNAIKLTVPPILKPIELRKPEPRRVSRESERDRVIGVKSVTELALPELCESTLKKQSSGFDSSLLGGLSDRYVPDLILQGTIEKPSAWEGELRRDLDVTSYLNKQADATPVQAVAIIGDTNTWEVRVVGRECGAGGMSSLVGATLDALPAMWKAKVPAHQCLSFLEHKLREFCVLSKTLADMLMSTDFCDIATLTKSLNIDVNDVPLLLAVATTHTPQVATRYGISYR